MIDAENMTLVSTFQRGFSLIEAIVVIAISGIMVAAVAMFLRWPFQAYLDTARHGLMTDVLDTTVRRFARELHTALPNSVRTTNSGANITCLEFLPTITGGRYRANVDGTAAGPPPNNGDILDFTIADSSFDAFGTFTAAQMVGNQVVVYNLGPSSPPANAYGPPGANNAATVLSVAAGKLANETNISVAPATLFPLASPGSRFQVIGPVATGSVSYVFNCPPGLDPQNNGLGTVTRVEQLPIAAAQVCPPAPGAGQSAFLAINVSSCGITYTAAGSATQRDGLVSTQLGITQANDAVSLYHEVHVNNAP
jgi:MSHA biogenesis protein MshO